MVTIAAAGDVHASEATRARLEQSFAELEERVDLVLLAGDLTTLGEPEQAQVLAGACAGVRVPVCAVLGNHDLHSGRGDEVADVLRDAGVHMLNRSSTTTCFPASPNSPLIRMRCSADNASSSVLHTITPLPAARPTARGS